MGWIGELLDEIGGHVTRGVPMRWRRAARPAAPWGATSSTLRRAYAVKGVVRDGDRSARHPLCDGGHATKLPLRIGGRVASHPYLPMVFAIILSIHEGYFGLYTPKIILYYSIVFSLIENNPKSISEHLQVLSKSRIKKKKE